MKHLPYLVTPAARRYEKLKPVPVSVVLDNVRSLYNVGSVFRTADGAGSQRLYLTGITGHPDPLRLVDKLRERGWEIAAVETSLHSVDLFDWQPAFPVCLVFGHEVDGIRPELLDTSDTHVRIPMLGRKQSLNVATAAGVVLFELLRKYRGMAEKAGS